MSGLLLCTDLDRTLLPNGPQEESPGARECLRRLVGRGEVILAYVSGRHRELVLDAMEEFDLPAPDWVIGDVGTTLWRVGGDGAWTADENWATAIDRDWAGCSREALQKRLSGLTGLVLQPPEKQNRHKLSYFLPADADTEMLALRLREKLEPAGVRARFVFSIDETSDEGLLDVLPERASKRHAIEALMARLGLDERHTVFCGDSGNDLEVLASPIPAVLVGNATDSVRARARQLARADNTEDRIYFARGGFLGMNGHYAAGMLEGIAHYHPHTVPWMTGEAGTA